MSIGESFEASASTSPSTNGWMFTRYNITDVKRKRSALELAQQFRDAQATEAAQESNVVAMRK
jgi:hypothetical protein